MTFDPNLPFDPKRLETWHPYFTNPTQENYELWLEAVRASNRKIEKRYARRAARKAHLQPYFGRGVYYAL